MRNDVDRWRRWGNVEDMGKGERGGDRWKMWGKVVGGREMWSCGKVEKLGKIENMWRGEGEEKWERYRKLGKVEEVETGGRCVER